ncbi:MAG: hypothetical protein IKB12_09700 [Clostridia bacterium]|nr:hypothetical protein [Clostridia bacterium]
MAGYRPKSLDELNEMYDKTITAEKAIIKATKQLHDVTETIVPSDLPAKQPEAVKEDTPSVEEFSSEVDSLINRFKEEIQSKEIKEVKKAEIPEIKEAPAATPERISFEKEEQVQTSPIAESKPVAPAVQSKPKVHYSLEASDELQQKATAKSEERTDLFNDYMKIMNDDDDDFFSKRESFKKKDKKKKHKKGLFFRHEIKEEEAPEENTEASAETEEENDLSLPLAEAEDTSSVKEVIYTPEIPEENQNFKVEFEAEQEETAEDEEEFTSFTEYAHSETAEEEPIEAFVDEDEAPTYEEEVATQPDFDIITDENDEVPPVPEEIADKTFDEFMNESQDIYSFDPTKKNTLPEYAKDQYSEEDDEEEEEYDDETEITAPVNKKGIIAGRVILSIVLALLTVLATGIIGINTLLGVNTGRTAFDEKYIFTATQDYTNSNILEGDLIVTEKRYANDGEVFAYINYTQQCFMFGKRNGSIVNDSGDVLFIAENDGERVLVLRDDTRGVVAETYPGIGKIVTVCTDYFIPVIAALLILGLVLVLLLAFVFKDKDKAYNKMMKKMIKKGVISAEEETEYDFSEDTDEENHFSSIE